MPDGLILERRNYFILTIVVGVMDGEVVVVVVPPLPFGDVVDVECGPTVVVVVVVVLVVVVVVTGGIGGIGGCSYTCIALGTGGCTRPGSPEPNAMRTFFVICTTGEMGQLPINGGQDDPRAATHKLVPVANTPSPDEVV